MGWSELRKIPNEYNEAVKEIDEKIINLISTRRSLTKGRRFSPSNEQIAEWSEKFEMEEFQINLIIHNLQAPIRPHFPNELGQLLNVVSIMKKSIADSCEYMLTHAMQHENVSVVFVEIRLLNEEKNGEVHLKPNLMLEVISDQEFTVRRSGSRGGGSHTELQFMISPPLPDSLDHIEFSLAPCAIFMEHKIQEIVLDQQVDFE